MSTPDAESAARLDEPASPRALLANAALVASMEVILVGPYVFWAIVYPTTIAWCAVLTGTMLVAPLLLRFTRPNLMLALITVAGVAQLILVPGPTAPILAIPVAVYSYARWVDGRRSRWVLVIGAFAAVLGPVRWNLLAYPPKSEQFTLYVLAVLVCAGLVVTPYAFGRRVRDAALIREARSRRQAEVYRALLAEREQAARFAEARARSQIARELHDIVAHSLSVMIVQAEGGKALATKRPEAAAEVLGTIAETGRDALSEMRRIVGVLRGGSEEPAVDYAPTPTLADIPEMVRRSSDRVELTVEGTPPLVPTTLGLTGYRVVQEAVTNVLKHAGPTASARVLLHYEPDLITLEVRDDGEGAAVRGDGLGHGLKGMHERVASMGGRLVARPLSEGGFLVRALLPVPTQARDLGVARQPDEATRPDPTRPSSRPVAPAARPPMPPVIIR